MTIFLKVLGVGVCALAFEAPVSAQGYVGNGSTDPSGGYRANEPRANRQLAINQCASATQSRLGTVSGGRVLGIIDANAGGDGGVMVRGVATSGRNDGGNGMQLPVDLAWRCRTDVRGFILEVTINRATYSDSPAPAPRSNDYSQYGYHRY